MEVRLIDLLNGAVMPDEWTGTDREVLSAVLAGLRRRTAVIEPAKRVSVRGPSARGAFEVFEEDRPRRASHRTVAIDTRTDTLVTPVAYLDSAGATERATH